MRLLMLILFFPFSFEGENGREQLERAPEPSLRRDANDRMDAQIAKRVPTECRV